MQQNIPDTGLPKNDFEWRRFITYMYNADIPPYTYVSYQVASGTNGGTSTGGAWTTRPLNTIANTGWQDVTSQPTLASNQVTLPPGTYWAEGLAQARDCDGASIKLYNITDSVDIEIGASAFTAVADVVVPLMVKSQFVLSKKTVIALQYFVTTGVATTGLGVDAGTGSNNTFAWIKIWKIR